MTLTRALLVVATLVLSAMPAWAQTPAPEDTLDQSLLNSEPVEETPTPAVPDKAAKTATPPPPPVAQPTNQENKAPAIEGDTALLQGLKKVSAESSNLAAPIDTPVKFGTLTITVKKCMHSAPDERPENAALMLIEDNKPGQPTSTVFSGWMFSSSPAISALEHPVYDITVLECVTRKKSR